MVQSHEVRCSKLSGLFRFFVYLCLFKVGSIDSRSIVFFLATLSVFAYGNKQCQQCQEDTICWQEVKSSCPLHSSAPGGSSNITHCVCDEGYRALANHTCVPCGVNFYCPGDETRVSCPVNTMTLQLYATNVEDCVCVPGRTGVACLACAAGKFKPEPGSGECTMCPVNTYNTVQGQTSIESCVSCQPHSTSGAGSTAQSNCICDDGWFVTDNTCHECSVGSYGQNAQCFACERGTYNSQLNATECTSCPLHSNTKTLGAVSATQCICLAGYFSTFPSHAADIISCQECAPGTSLNSTAIECDQCGPGKYQPALAAVQCIDCPPNSTHSQTSMTAITDCLCLPGFYRVADECVPCAAGSAKAETSNAVCTPCAPGRFSALVGATTCTECPVNTVQWLDGQSSCVDCPGNSSSSSASASQLDCLCDPGFQINNCTSCDMATYIPCQMCPRGSYKSDHSLHACNMCPAGETTSSSGSINGEACTPCAPNTYARDTEGAPPVVCTECPAHSKSDVGSDGIEDCLCTAGFQPGESPGTCVECPIATYKINTANEACTACPAGTEGNATTYLRTGLFACVLCDAGKYEESNVCKNCPDDSHSASQSSQITSCTCNVGYSGQDGGPCSECAKGYFKNKTGNAQCLSCPVAKYSDSPAQTSCASCPLKTSSIPPATSLTSCACIPGYTGPDGGPCTQCPQGTYEHNNECVSCPSNQYYPISTAPYILDRCTRCPTKSISATGSYSIDACVCELGYLRQNQTTCVECPAGSYCPDQTTRTLCPANSNSASESSNISDCVCDPAFYGRNGLCEACEIDSFCPGGTQQLSCPGNSTTEGLIKRTSISDCVCIAGWYENIAGSCERCPRNSYCFEDHLTVCPLNSSAVRGSEQIIDCRCHNGLRLVGNVCEVCPSSIRCDGGDTDPISCANNASVLHGTCMCPSGMFCQEEDGVTTGAQSCDAPASCVPCTPNSYCADNAITLCQGNASSPPSSTATNACVCNDGWFLSSGTCVSCPHHHYCTQDGKDSCNSWDVNLQTSDQFNSQREHCVCQSGWFRASFLDVCKPCPKNYYCLSEESLIKPNVVACLPNEYTFHEGSTSRADCICDAGHKMGNDGQVTKCLPCDEGERCQHGIVLEFACHFQKRTANADHSKCVCMEGFYEDDTLTCRPCLAGTSKSDAGDHQCTSCLANEYSANFTQCMPCDLNSISPPESSICTCNAPYVRGAGDIFCELCPSGTHYVSHGQYENGACVSCPPNSTSQVGANEIADCICDKGFVRSNDECMPCPVDHYESDGVCESCGTGASSISASFSDNQCKCNASNCQYRTWVYDGSACHGSCEPSLEECLQCDPGFFKHTASAVGNTDTCEPCDYNLYQHNYGSTECLHCVNSRQTLHLASTDVNNCTCRPGHEPPVPNIRTSNCTHCRLGHFKKDPGDYNCHVCVHGSFADETGMTQCKSCSVETPIAHANTTILDGASDVSECVCLPGYTLQSDACIKCVSGSFKHEPGLFSCNYCGGNVSHYEVSLHNHYGDGAGGASVVSHCKQCPLNSGQDPLLIGPGGLVMDDVNDCLCFGGFDSFNTETGCTACDSFYGLHRVGYGTESCGQCLDNEYWISTYQDCVLCSLDDEDPAYNAHELAVNSRFNDTYWGMNEGDCVCRLGYFRHSNECRRCAEGTFRSALEVLVCTACPLDTFADDRGTVTCQTCPANAFTTSTGSSQLSDCLCRAGYAWNDTACVACEPGFYKDADDPAPDNRPPCKACDSPTYSDEFASVACTECGVNMHSEAPRNSIATCECNAGFGGNPCTKCFYGLFSGGGVSENQHRECQECPSGKTTILNASTVIEDCVCRPGHGTGDVSNASAVCSLCEDGYYAPGLANVLCTHCGFGGVTHPEQGAQDFDACMCNHELGLFEFSPNISVLEIDVVLGVSLSEFNAAAEDDFEASLAETAGVGGSDVTVIEVLDTSSRRRLLAAEITVKSEIHTADPDAVQAVITPERLRQKMLKRPRFKKDQAKWVDGITTDKLHKKKKVLVTTAVGFAESLSPPYQQCVHKTDPNNLPQFYENHNYYSDNGGGMDCAYISSNANFFLEVENDIQLYHENNFEEYCVLKADGGGGYADIIEHCCGCGGGIRDARCNDQQHNAEAWKDSEDWTCLMYEMVPLRCDTAADYTNNGLNAQMACCVCGGGEASNQI